MAHWARDFTLAGAGAQWPVAAAFTGGVAAVMVELVDVQPTVVKLTDAGAVSWQRKYTLPSSNTVSTGCSIAANADGTRIAIAVDDTSGGTTVMMLDGADGDILWETSLPMRLEWFYQPSGGKHMARRIAIASNDDVVLVGLASAGASHYLVRLLEADGSIDWYVDILDRTSLSSSTQEPRQIALDSNDDIIVATIGQSTEPCLYKFDGTDGSTLWSRKLNFVSGFIDYMACVGPSDVVYAAGKGNSGDTIRVIKLDSAGATDWEADLDFDTNPDNLFVNGSLAADGSNLYISVAIEMPADGLRAGMVILEADGSAAQGLIYRADVAGAIVQQGTGGATHNATSFFLAAEKYFHDTFYYDTVIFRHELPTISGGDFDPGAEYVSEVVDVTVSAGSATATSFTPDFDAPATLTPASSTSTAGSITYTTSLYELASVPADPLIRFASSLGPTTQFGTPRNSWSWPATSLGPTTVFGTAAYDDDAEVQAVSLGPTSRLGTPYGFAYFGDAPPHYAPSIGQVTVFGSPAAATEGSYGQGVTPVSTAFGTPIAGRIQAASSLGPTAAFGTPALVGSYPAFGIASTAFGTPISTAFGEAVGWQRTTFGTPRLFLPGQGYAATGLGPTTAFGTPALVQLHLARPLYPTTRFGEPSALQGCA